MAKIEGQVQFQSFCWMQFHQAGLSYILRETRGTNSGYYFRHAICSWHSARVSYVISNPQ